MSKAFFFAIYYYVPIKVDFYAKVNRASPTQKASSPLSKMDGKGAQTIKSRSSITPLNS